MKQIVRFVRNLSLVFISVFILSVAKGNDTIRHQPLPVEMKLIGNWNQQPLFQLTVSGDALRNDYTITVRDEFHEILYRERVKEEQFSKRFLLNADELGDAELMFEIFCNKTKEVVTYKVNSESRLFQNFSVVEVQKH